MIIFYLDDNQVARNLMLKFVKAQAGDVIPLSKEENEALKQNHVMFIEEMPVRYFFKADDEVAESLAKKLHNSPRKEPIGLTKDEMIAYRDRDRFWPAPYIKYQWCEPVTY